MVSRHRSPSPKQTSLNSRDISGAENRSKVVLRNNAKNDGQNVAENVTKIRSSYNSHESDGSIKSNSMASTIDKKNPLQYIRASDNWNESNLGSKSASDKKVTGSDARCFKEPSLTNSKFSSSSTFNSSSTLSSSSQSNVVLKAKNSYPKSDGKVEGPEEQARVKKEVSFPSETSQDILSKKSQLVEKQKVKTKKLGERSKSPSPSGSLQKDSANLKSEVRSSSERRPKSGPIRSEKSDKSIEQILTEALQLTEDEKAALHRSRAESLAQKWHNCKQEDSHQMKERRRSPSPYSQDRKSHPRSGASAKSLSSSHLSSSPTGLEPSSSSIYISTSSQGNSMTKDCYSSPVNYAKTRFANVINDPSRGLSIDRVPTNSMVNEVKQAWERKAAVSSGHPSLLKNSGRSNPIRPYLTKGSVAERVMLFEKRPEVKSQKEKNLDSGISLVKTKSPVLSNNWKSQVNNKESEVASLREDLADRRSSTLKSTAINWTIGHDIPRFHFPSGRPYSQSELEARSRKIMAEFACFTDRKASKDSFGRVCKASGLPLYWKQPLYEAVVGDGRKNVSVSCEQYLKYWKDLVSTCHDRASKFVKILSHGKENFLIAEDFVSMMQDVIESHPGLGFLREAAEFHSRYVHTVIARIFYCVNMSWTGRITVAELRKSNFLAVVDLLEEEEDINQITDYFSYEHFYVIYCKFWELDRDHDLIIDKEDLMRHNEAAISSRMIDRIFSGAVTKRFARKTGKMTYFEFVWFLMSEEDKRHPRSIEYWFRCMDIDGDGFLSMYELEYFYEEQVKRMEALCIEALPFNDCICQMLDMIRPKIPAKIALSDLRRCKMTPVFFDTFFNLDKYLDHEQRDPFATKDHDESVSDWDKFAAEEYELLVAEESAQHSTRD